MFWIVLWKYRKGHILAITNPPLTPFIPWVLGCRFDILVYDVYPDALVSYNYLSERNLIVRTWRWLNRKAFSKARKVYTLSESMKLLVSRYVSSEKIQIVPIWTDNKFIQPVPKEENQFLSDKDYKEKFIISYAGNMGQTHPVEILLEVAELLDPNLFHFVLAGGGYKYDLIKEKLQLKSIPNVSLYSWQPVEILPHVLSAASLSVVTLDEDAAALSVPSKTFNSFSVGNPILAIASPDSELKRLLEHYNCGVTFSSSQINEIADYIRTLEKNPQLYAQLADNSLKASLDFTEENAKELVK